MSFFCLDGGALSHLSGDLDWVIELVTSNSIRSNHRIDFPIQKARGFSTPLRIILKFPFYATVCLYVPITVKQILSI